MTSQDADEQEAESPAAEDRTTEEDGTVSSEESEREDAGEPVTELLSELAERPEEGVEAALTEIVGDDPDDEHHPLGESTQVDERAVEEAETLPAERLAQTVAALRAELNRLREELQTERERTDDLESQLARKQAEFQNYKKRQKERLADEKERATEEFVTRLLDVRDNLARALEQDEDADIRGGVESTLQQFDQQLERENVTRIEPAVGEETDPRRHEVLAAVESDQPEDTVAQVHRPGYLMGEKVLRPAQVAVSEGSETDDETEQ